VLSRVVAGENGYRLAREAVASLEQHGCLPTPAAYEVFLIYHAGTNPGLHAELDRLFNTGASLSDHLINTLHDRFLGSSDISDQVMKTGNQIAREIFGVMEGLESAEARTRAYGQQLEKARTELGGADDPRRLRGVVDSLVGATGEMAEQSRLLEERLHQSAREVQALRTELEKVQVEASTDSLTGVANRKVFEARLAELAASQDRQGKPVALIMADIDLFKQVNDTWGHQTGDQVIRFVATILQRHAPKDALVARLGGEEFALLVPNCDTRMAQVMAEAIRASVETKKLIRRSSNEELGRITVSLGVAQRERGESREGLIERADGALYASKRSGRNKVTVAGQEADSAAAPGPGRRAA
jgi:diguanylate cyclase